MGSLPLTSNKALFTTHFPCFSSSHRRTTTRTLYLNYRKYNTNVFASRSHDDDNNTPKFDNNDLMELKFGRLLGEDPKLTLAKIMGKKANPDVSYLDIEKSFYKKKKGKVVEIEELPFEVERPWAKNLPPKQGLQFKPDDDKKVAMEINKPNQPQSNSGNVIKSSVPNVILRKPSLYKEDENEDESEGNSSRLRIRPNLSLKMQSGQVKEKFSDMTLLRKPESSIAKNTDSELKVRKEEPNYEVVNLTLLEQPHRPSSHRPSIKKQQEQFREPSDDVGNLTLLEQPHRPNVNKQQEQFQEPKDEVGNLTLLEQPHRPSVNKQQELFQEPTDEGVKLTLLEQPHRPSGKEEEEEQFGDARVVVPNDGSEQHEQIQSEVHQELINLNQLSDLNSVDSKTELSVEAAIQGKPKRLDRYVKKTSQSVEEETASLDPGGRENSEESGNLVDVNDIQEREDADWTKAEGLIKTGDRADVELVSCSTKGFVVSFGTLVGFLPYRNLLSRWKFLAFESWLRQKGLDPSLYKQTLATVTNYDAENNNISTDSPSHIENDGKFEDKISPDMKLEDLLRIYDQEKNKFLSSFIRQKVKAYVLLADRKLKKLMFSLKPKEKEELTEKKRNLMARLQVGDLVKCRVQKITYFGIFVEVEGVSALVHQSEISWDPSLDPSNYFKIDQVVEAKVHQLNSALGRIFLSLKEVTPDPLMESLESVVGDHEPFDGRLEAAQTDEQWSEVESLIKELQKIEGVQSVSKGRFFRSPGLAPTFQVYMASIFENQYKLLARSGNKIQEVIVQTSLDKETMKSALMTCANRVE
ncbi:uncharacterized protein [Cicer arietinum]|uniref:Uncharacterized protein LOC101512963 n=1 Tax=Cicer arietinum TaxID=3827 RepID=A0A1S2YET7_CICAR|nr:uncharacterized protein LOC101512963 [Cicer arietinum]